MTRCGRRATSFSQGLDFLFEEPEAAQQDICKVEDEGNGCEVGPERDGQRRRFALRVKDILGMRLEPAPGFIADGPEDFGVRRIEVVFVRIGIRQNPRRPAALGSNRAEQVRSLS